MRNYQETYITSDFANASALLALGHKLEMLDRSRPDGRVNFVFQKDNWIEQDAEAHFAERLKIVTTQYYSAQRILKARLHNS